MNKINVVINDSLTIEGEVILERNDHKLCLLQDRLVLLNKEGRILYSADLLEMYPELWR